MKAMMKKVLPLVLAVVLLCGILPMGTLVGVGAADTVKSGDDGTTNWDFIEPVTHQKTVPNGYIGIYTAQDLDGVRNNLGGSYILMNDIDLGSWGEWVPIGETSLIVHSDIFDNARSFEGVFDGNGYAIKNMSINSENEAVGLFGAAGFQYGSNCRIEDVNVFNCNIISQNAYFVGGIVGLLKDNGGIGNCLVSGEINVYDTKGTYYDWENEAIYPFTADIGGVAGSASAVFNCRNTALINVNYGDNSGRTGGISGHAGRIEGCINSGRIYIGNGSGTIGGIVGSTNASSGYHALYECSNSGNIFAPRGGTIGGIVGEFSGQDMSKCHNSGNIIVSNGGGYIGGVSGYVRSINNMKYCSNIGDITVDGGGSISIGGLSGYYKHFDSENNIIEDCYNTGNITSRTTAGYNRCGGLVGEGYNNIDLQYCYNLGEVDAKSENETYSDGSDYGPFLALSSGGLIGYYHPAFTDPVILQFNHCYFVNSSTEIIGRIYDEPGLPECAPDTLDVQALSKSQFAMISSFVGYKFGTVWNLPNGGEYPIFFWQDYENANDEPEEPTDPTPAPAITTKKISLDLAAGKKDISFKWGNSFFTASNTAYNHDLATAAMALSTAAYNESSVNNALGTLGFGSIETHYNDLAILDYTRFSIAHKTVGSQNIIAVVVRGTADNTEWFSNLFIQIDGFRSAEHDIYNALSNYMSTLRLQNDYENKFFITGHSRGAAVANLLGQHLVNDGYSSSVYDYTFATPNTRYSNEFNPGTSNGIFNICNSEDIVAMVPPFEGHFGKTLWYDRHDSPQMDNAFMSFYGDSLDGIMGDLWIFSQSKKIAASHMSENYLAWLTSFGSTSSSNIYLNKYDVKFGYAACPVDIEIYDHAELIGKIIDNEVTYEDTVKVQLYVDGDVKYFWMPQDSQYTIKFAGTDTGTMDYFVADFDMISEQLLVQKSFQDVALYDGKEMISEITDTPDVKLLIVDGDNITGEVFEDGSESIPLQSIALNKATLSVIKGQTETLTVTYNPNGTTEDKTISWKTSDSKVAMVDASGVVTAVAKGTAIITATARSGATAECSVTVTDDSESDGDDDTTSATEQPAETITKPGENTTESSSIEEPSQSTTDNTSLNSKNNPDTGDNSSIWMFVFAFIFSAVLLAVTIRKKPRSVN